MTQQELADKLGVTDKAISKWENGRCLMDISMLKPLSELLDVSIVELINGERIEREIICSKTDEILKNTLEYTDIKLKKIKKRIIYVLLFIFLVSIVWCSIRKYKEILAEYIYYVAENYEYEKLHNYDFYSSELSLTKEIEIKVSKLSDSKYIQANNMKIRNDLLSVIKSFDDGVIWYGDNSNENIIILGIYEPMSYIEQFMNFDFECNIGSSELSIIGDIYIDDVDLCKYLKTNISKEDMEEFLIKNNINNDIDLFKFISKNYKYYINENNNMSEKYKIREMKDIYMFNKFVRYIGENLEEAYLITGDYDGYILVNQYVYDNKDSHWHIDCGIYKDDKFYFLQYITTNYNIEYVHDLLNTLVIE